MLSGESAIGDHPAKVVRVMNKILLQAESDAFDIDTGIFSGISHLQSSSDITNAICDAACTTARDLHAKAIITVTKTGDSARQVSKFRPKVPIVGATPEIKTYHQLALSWGVIPVLTLYQNNSDALFDHAIDCAVMAKIVSKGDQVVISAGVPLNIAGTTNIIKVETV
jgi:pyruvate kinase